MDFSFFEVGMLFCFGFAWPANIYKSLISRTAKGKSMLFLLAILLGYMSGIIHKLMYSRDIVLLLYILNFVMVLTDIVLCLRNQKRDRMAAK